VSSRDAFLRLDGGGRPICGSREHKYGDGQRDGRCLSDLALGGVKRVGFSGSLDGIQTFKCTVVTARSFGLHVAYGLPYNTAKVNMLAAVLTYVNLYQLVVRSGRPASSLTMR
jgi:hypothetical protein